MHILQNVHTHSQKAIPHKSVTPCEITGVNYNQTTKVILWKFPTVSFSSPDQQQEQESVGCAWAIARVGTEYIFVKKGIAAKVCGGLNKTVPHKFIYLNAREWNSLIKLEELGGMISLEEIGQRDEIGGFPKPTSGSVILSSLLTSVAGHHSKQMLQHHTCW